MGTLKLGGMTLRSLFKKPETTRYPFEKKTPPPGLKGHIVNDVAGCILCGMCARTCPTDAEVVDKKASTWSIDRFRCVQCGSCIRACPKQCLSMDPAYAPVATSKHVDVFAVPVREKKAKAGAES